MDETQREGIGEAFLALDRFSEQITRTMELISDRLDKFEELAGAQANLGGAVRDTLIVFGTQIELLQKAVLRLEDRVNDLQDEIQRRL